MNQGVRAAMEEGFDMLLLHDVDYFPVTGDSGALAPPTEHGWYTYQDKGWPISLPSCAQVHDW